MSIKMKYPQHKNKKTDNTDDEIVVELVKTHYQKNTNTIFKITEW
jgi:hypothetical protein